MYGIVPFALQPACCGLPPDDPTVYGTFYVMALPLPAAVAPKLPPPCSKARPEDCCPRPGDGSPGNGGPGGFVLDGWRFGGGSGGGSGGRSKEKCCPPATGGPHGGFPRCGGLFRKGGCQPPVFSAASTRYGSGEVALSADDLETSGVGLPWGHTRSFASRLSANDYIGNGFNWQVKQWPYLMVDVLGNVIIQGEPNTSYWFDKVGHQYVPNFNVKMSLTYDEGAGRYRLFDLDGSWTEFDDYTGLFRRRCDPAGNKIEVTAMHGNGFNFTQVERTCTSNGDTITEQFLYDYIHPTGDDLLEKVTVRRKVNAGPWNNVARAVYTYYSSRGRIGRRRRPADRDDAGLARRSVARHGHHAVPLLP